MNNLYTEKFIKTILDNSESSNWETAVTEWQIIDCEEDETLSKECVCGKENLKYLYTISNNINGNQIFPIGSSCIKKFNREDMNERLNISEKLFKLSRTFQSGKKIELTPELFSRNFLNWLYKKGAFDTDYNQHEGYSDYEFLLKMYNKRDKEAITDRQKKKITAILLNDIKPFLLKLNKNKYKLEIPDCKTMFTTIYD